jgi:GTP-binding protein
MSIFQNAEFIISCASKSQFPESELSELVMAGRSNVGKSSVINRLTQRKSLAYVGKKPGKTRLINFYKVPDVMMLVDVPGYGYAQRSMGELKTYGTLMEDYFSNRPQLKAVMLVVDCRLGLTQDDWDMFHFIQSKHLPMAIVATKSDKLTYQKKVLIVKQLKETTMQEVFLVSALKHEGIEALIEWCRHYI